MLSQTNPAIRYLKSILLLYLCYCWSANINAQAGIQYWNTENGLSNNTISQVLQDRNGYIWIATQYGLNRFDGYEFVQLRYRPNDEEGLSANWIRAMTQDSSGRIWLAAAYGGIHVVDPLTLKATRYPLVGSDGVELTNVRSVHCASDQSIWVGTSKKLFRKRLDGARFEAIEIFLEDKQAALGNSNFLQIQEDNDGHIYLLTRTDIYQYETASESFTSIFSAPNQVLKSIYTDHEGTLWGVTGHQLIQFRATDTTWTRQVFLEDNFNFDEFFFDVPIYEDQQNQLWIATQDGVLVVDKTSKEKKKISKEELFPTEAERANILCFFADQQQNIWMGTGNGLLLRSPLGQRFQAQQQIPHLEQFNEVRAIEQIGDSLFISNSSGLFVLDLRRTNQAPRKISNELIFDFLTTTDGYLYAVGYHFYQIQYANLSVETFDLDALAWSLAEDRNGNIWIASGINGLQRFNPQTKTFKSYHAKDIPTLDDNSSINLLVDSKDRLWISSLLSGVYVLENVSALQDNEVPVFLNFNYNEAVPGSLSNSLAAGIAEDLNGDIWVGTDGGLNRINGKDYSIKRYLQEDGLEDEKIMDLLIDQSGAVWGSTIGHGIFRLNLQTEQFTFFNRKDGLVNDNFLILTAHQNQEGLLYFGSRTQIQVIDPKAIDATPKTRVPFLFTKYATFGDTSQVSLLDQAVIELSYHIRSISVEYSTLNFYQADKTAYWYKIEELHDDWQSNGKERMLTFMALAPNAYTLKVKAVNPDLTFDQEIIELRIIIHPPWWKTTWAYLCYFLAFLLGVYAIYRFQLKEKLQQAEAERLQELDHLKTRFFTNITHELRTPLTIILGIAGQLRQVPKRDIQQKASLLKRNGQQLLDLINQILDLSKLEAGKLSINMQHGDLLPYLRYLLESFHSLAMAKDIRLHFLPQLPVLMMDYDAEKIKHIIINLLSNALKYTPEGGDVYLQITAESEAAIITCKDTGKGIAEGDLTYIFDRFFQVDDRNGGTGIGLSLVRELVHLLNGKIGVESEFGKGTTVEIRLPITSDVENQRPHKSSMITPTSEKQIESLPTSSPKGMEDTEAPLVLIVEDNADVRHFLIDSLKNDYRIETAKNGQAGIERALNSIPDLIVSDVMMPEKDGFELCKILKTNFLTSHIPIILLTAKADLDARLDGLDQGADAYIYKPFEPKELHIRIRKLLELRQTLQQRFQSPDFWQQQGTSQEEAFLQQAKQIIEAHLSDANFGIPQLCRKLGISRPHLHRKLKALTNQSTSLFIRSIRLQRARHLLQNSDLNISEIAYEVGFKDPAYFSKCYFEQFSETPSATRK